MAQMSKAYREQFLAKTRIGYLTTLATDGSPKTVPVWFDWDGHCIKVFTSKNSPKIKWLRQDPRITFVVSNEVNEIEGWVAFDGTVNIEVDEGMKDFLHKLADRYWDLSDPSRKAVLDSWTADVNQFYMLTLVPNQIRSYVA